MFEVYQSEKNKEYYFRLKAANGQNILASEGYTTKAACLNGIESVKKNARSKSKFEIKKAANGKVFFNLKAQNNQVIGTSQMYADMGGLNNGIDSVQKNARVSTPIREV